MLNTSAGRAYSTADNNRQTFQNIFTDWARAFNEKNLAATEALFADDCIASNPGAPHKDHASICEVFKKLFAQPERRYVYNFKIKDVYRTHNSATVRITWFLDIYEKGLLIAKNEEQGMDVFRRNKNGSWQIINFIAYSEDLPLPEKSKQSLEKTPH